MTIRLDKLEYVFCLKTTDAELRGVSELDKALLYKATTLPFFELTRSRATKSSEYGDIEKRMSALREIVGDKGFILDLTSHEDLVNPQIESLYDDSNGFQNWREFLSRYSDLKIIPAIHTYNDDFERELAVEVRELARNFPLLSFKSNIDTSPVRFLEVIARELGGLDRIVFVLDAEFVCEASIGDKVAEVSDRVSELLLLQSRLGTSLGRIVLLSSSFPKAVVGSDRVGGHDDFGEFRLLERDLFGRALTASDSLCYGDYASVHPRRYMARGGAWVPRIDLPLDETYVYTRYRREDGGYIRAAVEMVSSDWYSPVDCWGTDQIEAAASGSPNGRSPSFWIAVRVNAHLSRRLLAI